MPTPTVQRSWLASLAIYLRAPVITMLFLGFSAGLPFLLVFSTLSAWLRSDGVEVAAIGFFAWIGMLYSIKFFWAPVVDRLPLPLLTRHLGQRRGWMLLAQALIVAGLVGEEHLVPTAVHRACLPGKPHRDGERRIRRVLDQIIAADFQVVAITIEHEPELAIQRRVSAERRAVGQRI